MWPDFRGLPWHVHSWALFSPVMGLVARFSRATLLLPGPVAFSPVFAPVARFMRAIVCFLPGVVSLYLPPTAFSGHTPGGRSRFWVDFASLFLSCPPQLFSLAQFPRAGTHGVFDTRYMLGCRLTYRPRLGPRRAELLCFSDKWLCLKSNLCALYIVFFLYIVLLFVYFV